ncbi:hypothetical protein PLEOSDRAFT_1109419 [Pleurotus ostreatus PC15]|uniref:Major facilitator superfamily (MFS) profile domain-containing protein n=1 Tax=Pleurotus ostreatus (strain PC15) TaxID=1137138 RepID=A0A067N2S5_PLEO1|nr:hypothetical protein PLEOSDRAFT_1109419 [Pleurotus ostreatus PC15]
MSIEKENEKRGSDASINSAADSIDLFSYHEHNAGRLIVDPEEAKIELGDVVAAKLKLSPDGTKVLWPQPTDDPEDPQNWSDRRKALQLMIITLAAIVPDFDSGIGIAAIFALAEQYNTTTGVINNLTSNWSIFLLGWGGIFAVMLMRRLGRLPILFWSQVFAVGFLVGATFAPTLKTFTAFRCLSGFFATAPQVTGLFIVSDMYPFHKQARMLNVWTMGFIISPFLSPFAFGFLVARASWRWAYGIGCIYGAIVVALIVFFGEETIYDRTVKPLPPRPVKNLRWRVETLIGITGVRNQGYRSPWMEGILAPLKVVWRPHLLAILLYEAMVFGFAIGINVTNAVFLGSPPPVGFGFSPFGIAGAYGTPIVAVLLGELVGHYVNDWIMNFSIRRNNGVFEAESRLWACYIGLPLYICGFVTLGAAFQMHLSVGAVVMGWGIAQFAIMITTVAVYAYANDCFPKHRGEISGLINLARTLGGFSVAYFQVPWAEKHGALQTFGVEAAIVTGLFFLIVPTIQIKGRALRSLKVEVANQPQVTMDRKLTYKLPPTTITDKLVSQNTRRIKALEEQKRRRAEKFDSTRQLDLFADLSLGVSDDEADLNSNEPDGPAILREGLASYTSMLPASSENDQVEASARADKKRKGKNKRSKGASKGQLRRQSKWANQCMYAELLEMLDDNVWSVSPDAAAHDGLPEDLEKGWVCVAPVPVGKRCLAVVTAAPNGISPNTTLRSRLLGKPLMPRFPSSLPPETVLDCILDANWRDNGILHVLDVIKWKGQDIGDCEAPFRFWWRDTRLAELLPSPAPSMLTATSKSADVPTSPLNSQSRYQFPYPNTLVPVPYHTDTTLLNLRSQIIPLARSTRAVPVNLPLSAADGDGEMVIDAMDDAQRPVHLANLVVTVSSDGLLLYVAEATYEPGTSPLSSWIPIAYSDDDSMDGPTIRRPLDRFERLIMRRLEIASGAQLDIDM